MANRNKSSQGFRFRSDMLFGQAAAEQDALLSECFFPTDAYRIARDIEDPRSGLIGRSGSGKTAILERLKLDCYRTVSIDPEELAFQYLSNSDMIRALRESGVNLDYFYKLLWRHVFVVEILKHRYPEESRQTGLLSQLVEQIKRSVRPNQARTRAIKYLDGWGATVLQKPHERIQHIHDTFEKQLRLKMGADGPWLSLLGLGVDAEGGASWRREVEERIKTAQDIVSQVQVQELNAVRDFIGTEVIDDPQNPCFVLIDDLDKFWVEEPVLYELIRGLLLEIYDWSRVPNVKIIYTLRDNVLYRLERDYRSRSYQREKLADQQMRLQWTHPELIDLVDMRFARLARSPGSAGTPRLENILPKKTNNRPSGIDYILDRTLNRPRDVIAFLNNASRLAVGKNRLVWDALYGAEQAYSEGRLRALFDEWHENYDGLDIVSEKMLMGRKPRFPISDWNDGVLLDLFTDGQTDGRSWLKSHSHEFDSMYQTDEGEAARHFASLFATVMYEVGLIGIKNYSRESDIYANARRPVLTAGDIHHQSEVHIHPMFHAALRTDVR